MLADRHVVGLAPFLNPRTREQICARRRKTSCLEGKSVGWGKRRALNCPWWMDARPAAQAWCQVARVVLEDIRCGVRVVRCRGWGVCQSRFVLTDEFQWSATVVGARCPKVGNTGERATVRGSNGTERKRPSKVQNVAGTAYEHTGRHLQHTRDRLERGASTGVAARRGRMANHGGAAFQ